MLIERDLAKEPIGEARSAEANLRRNEVVAKGMKVNLGNVRAGARFQNSRHCDEIEELEGGLTSWEQRSAARDGGSLNNGVVTMYVQTETIDAKLDSSSEQRKFSG